jgi:mono/diheme cytochrome c family protein
VEHYVIAVSITVGFRDVAWAQGREFGKDEYKRSCASCHGVTGKGDGLVAKSLAKAPAELTKLSEKNNGVFPSSRV